MNTLHNLLVDLFHCFNLPVYLLSHDYECLDLIGNKAQLPPHHSISTSSIESNHIIIDEISHYLCHTITHKNNHPYYLILGPFTTNLNHQTSDVSFKPIHCLTYLNHTIKAILRDYTDVIHPYPPYVMESIAYIHKHYNKPIQLDIVSQHLNLNKSYLSTLFKQWTHMTFSEFLNRYRTERSKKYLTHSNETIMDVALNVGFNNHTYYSTTFKSLYGLSPIEYRKKYTK